MNFADRLIAAIKNKKSVACVGLDPHWDQIPAFLKEGRTPGEAILAFNKGIIDAISDLVPIVKPQLAFYEKFGMDGLGAFWETIKYAKEKGLLVLADGKRDDIGSTAVAYAQAYLDTKGEFGQYIDALTVNAYLGSDGVKPFVDLCREHDKGIFVLVKTSNPSSGELQDLRLADGMTVKEKMASLVARWGQDLEGKEGYSAIGAVVGATYPEDFEKLRAQMPQQIFLIPGYGAQGGTAADLKTCFDEQGLGAIVNSSRGIIFAYTKDSKYSEEDFAEAAREAVLKMNGELAANYKF